MADINIDKAVESFNLVDELEEDKLTEIGNFVHEGYSTDLESRKQWELNVDKWTKLALQAIEKRNFPWQNSSNVKYPLLSTAAMQFAARSYPALVPSDGKVVSAKIIGRDPTNEKTMKAQKIAEYMSWQLLYDMDNWEEEMDKLLVVLPVVGLCFKKTYWDGTKKQTVSKLVLPKDLVVNYWAKSLEETERKTERIEMPARILKERQLEGVYKDVELTPPDVKPATATNSHGTTVPASADSTTPYVILEQHTFYDLDGDGYPEPYIITIEESSKKVLRIVARFTPESVLKNTEGKIARIVPTEYYTKFPFIPNPDGSFYDVGFGLLLGSLNETINSSINQVIDAGTLQILPSGFIGKNLRLREGEVRFKAGEWKQVNATGEQMKNSILPLPAKEPSNTTLSLMQAMIQSGKELASVAEIFTGKMPGQNTPATTTMASVEQGMKLFTAVYKRIYKALEKEYKKLFYLNSVYLDPIQAQEVLDDELTVEDFDRKKYDVCPGADPTAFSSTQKLLKAQGLMEVVPLGTIDPVEVTRRILEAQEQPNIDKLLRQGPPPPDPKQVEMQAKMQMEQQKNQGKMQMDQFKAELAARDRQLQLSMEAQKRAMEAEFRKREAALDLKLQELEARTKLMGAVSDVKARDMKHRQELRQKEEMHAQKMKQAAQQPAKKD